MNGKRCGIFFFIFLLSVSCSRHKVPGNPDLYVQAPTDLMIEVLDAHTFQISWKNPVVSQLKSVRIYKSLNQHPSLPSEGVLIYQGLEEVYIDRNLIAGQRYYYSIFAFYDSGAFSDRVSANALPFDLLLPRNFLIEKKIGSISFQWEKPYDVHYTGIRILRSKDAYPQSPFEGELVYEGNQNSFEDGLNPQKPLEKEIDYFYSFFSYNENKKYSLKAYQLKAFCWAENSFSVRVEIESPLANAIVNKIIQIRAKAETLLVDSNSITKTELSIDGSIKQTLLTEPFVFNWDSSVYAENTHTVTITSYNSKGISASKSIPVTVDRTPPAVSFLLPAENSTIEGMIKISGQAADLNGINRVDLFLDGNLIASDLKAPYVYYFATDGMQVEGSHIFKLEAYDLAGNKSFAERAILINNRPFITAVSPGDLSENISYTGEVAVTFSEAILPATADSNSFSVKKENGQIVPGSITYESGTRTLIFKPVSYFEPNVKYIAEVTSQIQDLTGLSIKAPKTWSFVTSAYTNLFDDPGALFDYSTFAD